MRRIPVLTKPTASMSRKKPASNIAVGRKKVQVNSQTSKLGKQIVRPSEHVKTEIALVESEYVIPEHQKPGVSRRIKKVQILKNKHQTYSALPAKAPINQPPSNFLQDDYSTATVGNKLNEGLNVDTFDLDAEEMPTFSSGPESQANQNTFFRKKQLRSNKHYTAQFDFPDDLLDPVEFAVNSPEPVDYLQMSNNSDLPAPLVQEPRKLYLKGFDDYPTVKNKKKQTQRFKEDSFKEDSFKLDEEEMPSFSSGPEAQPKQDSFFRKKQLRSNKHYTAQFDFPDDLLDPVEFAVNSPEPVDYLQMSNKSGLPTPLIQEPRKLYLKGFYDTEQVPPKLHIANTSLLADESFPFVDSRENRKSYSKGFHGNQHVSPKRHLPNRSLLADESFPFVDSRENRKSYSKGFHGNQHVSPKRHLPNTSLLADESFPFVDSRENTLASEGIDENKMRILEKYIRDEATKILPRFENMEPVSEFKFSSRDKSSLDPLGDSNRSLLDNESCFLVDSNDDVLEVRKLEKYIKKEGSKILSRFEFLQPESEFSYSQRKLKNNLLTDSERISQENFSLLSKSFATVDSDMVPEDTKFQLSEINKKINSLREKRFLLMQDITFGSENNQSPIRKTPPSSHTDKEAKVRDYLNWPYSSAQKFKDELFPSSRKVQYGISEPSPLEDESMNLVNDSMGSRNVTAERTPPAVRQTRAIGKTFVISSDKVIDTSGHTIYNSVDVSKDAKYKISSSKRNISSSANFPAASAVFPKENLPTQFQSQMPVFNRGLSPDKKVNLSRSFGQLAPAYYNSLLENESEIILSDISVYETPNIESESMSLLDNDTLSTDPELLSREFQGEMRRYIDSKVLDADFPHSGIMDESPPAMMSLENSDNIPQYHSGNERQVPRYVSPNRRQIMDESPPLFSTSEETILGFSPDNLLSTSTPRRPRQPPRYRSDANRSHQIMDESPPLFSLSHDTDEALNNSSHVPKTIRFRGFSSENLFNSQNDRDMIDQNPRAVDFTSFQSVDYGKQKAGNVLSDTTLTESLMSPRSMKMSVSKIDNLMISSASERSSSSSSGDFERTVREDETTLICGPKTKKWKFGMQVSGFEFPRKPADLLLSNTKNFAQLQKLLSILSEESLNNVTVVNVDGSRNADTKLNVQNTNYARPNPNSSHEPETPARASKLTSAFTRSSKKKT